MIARWSLLSPALVAAACVAPDPPGEDDATDVPPHPLDDVLRVNHVQAIGTHNSYHLQPDTELVQDWNYSHAPLDVQLGEQGVRQFELDCWWDSEVEAFTVQHIPLLDDATTCAWLTDCLAALKGWSDEHPLHHPLMLLIEPKDEVDDSVRADYVERIEQELRSVWPRDRLLAPDDVQGDAPSVREGLAAEGWPTLGAARGRMVVQLHSGALAEAYTRGWQSLEGRAMFPAVGADSPFAGFLAMNDPVADLDAIAAAVDAGLLVRTRADASRDDFEDGDLTRLEAALASGAHALSTDHPTPDEATGYAAAIPGGTPSGCNPRTAPPECTPDAIEDPARVSP